MAKDDWKTNYNVYKLVDGLPVGDPIKRGLITGSSAEDVQAKLKKFYSDEVVSKGRGINNWGYVEGPNGEQVRISYL